MTRRTALRFAGAAAAVGGLAVVAPSVLGSGAATSLNLAVDRSAPAQPGIGSGSVTGNIRKFDLYARSRVVSISEVADALRMTRPVSLREVNRRLGLIQNEVRLGSVITTEAALGGRAELALRSDGTFTSSGHMRATGFPSFAYQVTVNIRGDSGTFLPTAFHQGRVFGTDTPGDRQRNWNESGRNENIRQGWLGIAENPVVEVRKEYNVDGVLGAVADVAVKIAEFAGVAVVANPGIAALLTLGSALDEAVDLPAPHRDLPLGVTVAAGVLLVFGPAAIVPAVVAGGVAELAVRTRTLRDEEWDFARKVFGDTLPPRESIILTNMLGKGDRRYVMPIVGGKFLVNMGGAAFDNPMAYTNSNYNKPGQLLIHELTHTWQGRRWPAVTYFCQGITETSYSPGGQTSRAWGDYGIEQQATIVDRWYASFVPNPDPADDPVDAASTAFYDNVFRPQRDPDYTKKPPHSLDRYIYGNVRAGLL